MPALTPLSSCSVLACKFVDEVVIGSPTVITQDLLTTFNISLVRSTHKHAASACCRPNCALLVVFAARPCAMWAPMQLVVLD